MWPFAGARAGAKQGMATFLAGIGIAVVLGLVLTFVVGPAFLALVGIALLGAVVWWILAARVDAPVQEHVRRTPDEQPDLLGPGGADDPDAGR
jgi:hypothetical protein